MTSLDKQSGAADDSHIVRIVRLETQMDNVTSVLATLQRTQEQNHLAMLAQFETMRNQINGLHDKIDAAQRYTIDRMDNLDNRLTNRIDRLYYWMVGFTVTNFAALLGIVVRWAYN